jgi:hypothetical protein
VRQGEKRVDDDGTCRETGGKEFRGSEKKQK